MQKKGQTLEPAKKQKIVLIHKGMRSFVKKDYQILATHYRVAEFGYTAPKGLVINLWYQLKLLGWLLRHLPGSKLVYIWFAGYHSFLPVLLGRLMKKKILIAIGGYETTYIPEIRYGVFSNPLRSFMARFSFKQAHLLLPVDNSILENLKRFVPDLTTPSRELTTGYDATFWKRIAPKEAMVLTVASLNSEVVFRRKGIDLFIETARLLPDIMFVIVGVEDAVRGLIPDLTNIQALPATDAQGLRKYYSRAKVYAQFSMYEGFPNVVSEAMLCECIPVVTAVSGMPRQVGECGFVLEERDAHQAAALIQKALQAPPEQGQQCRQRMVEHFPFNKREKELLEIVGQYV